MVGLCRFEDAQPTTMFNLFIGKMYTAISMPFYISRFVEARGRGYTILPEFTAPSDPHLFRDVNLPFDVSNDVDLEGKTQLSFS